MANGHSLPEDGFRQPCARYNQKEACLRAVAVPQYISQCKSTYLCADFAAKTWHTCILEWMMEGSVRMMFYYASLDLTELHFCMQSLQSEVAVAKNVEGKTMVW